MKIVINVCYGGFGLSDKAISRFRTLEGIPPDRRVDVQEIPRDNINLVLVVEELGGFANSRSSDVKVVEVPDDVNWFIQEYDGVEWIAERHRTWQ